ncbi:hypothetical protein BOTBODRAFT_35308 [Botryobasidium botryosum FD-172 SS1]|uniref:Uncharacterized protein n=1 Tax=Botryobasidium botryosum (strain FD-172 SS1) TaxID=930990 RepID=A0A067MHR6_BOTB1|nr:hypothetical protein BOTBODRAFT_35308 [Botryobasidium botryosum FD-172 SS1]
MESMRSVLSLFRDVSFVSIKDSGQTFLVNITTLGQKPKQEEDEPASAWTAFISLDPSFPICPTPEYVIRNTKALVSRSGVATNIPHHFELPAMATGELIALGGNLLEYPVSYVPRDSDSGSFLSGIPLNVYHCYVITADSNTQRTIMRFSCPTKLADRQPDLHPNVLSKRIQDRWQPRLSVVEGHGWHEAKVSMELKTLERVAL